ncbi:MAG: CorA family divalent cation transporter, partial [Eubacteriales bacterium]|nr:CorA family divalent cation transporter [Eubacteriales bacterium]
GLVDDDHMRVMTLYIRRIDRLLSNILVLREYVTQVRESYEAETDINLNSIMRLFTVVTVIFLPLTLLVGWYGMNLPMPEYQWSWSYPLVIALSLMIVVLTILIFRKNKWF